MRTLILSTLALAVATVTASETLDLNQKEMLQSLESNGLTLEKGKTVTLKVKGNPTTGYTWNVDHARTNGVFSVSEQY